MHGSSKATWLLLAALAGCQSTQSGPALSKAPPMKPQANDASIVRAAPSDAKKRNEPPMPSTMVAVGSYREQLAANPELTFAQSEQIRASARAAYHDALKLDPKCTAAYIGLAKSYIDIDDANQAYAMFDRALKQMPNDPNIWYENGLTHARFKDFDGAVACFQHATQIDPDNRLYKRTMGLAYARSGRFDEARQVLRTCMKEEEAYYTLARMACHIDRADVGREYLAMALKVHPTYMPAQNMWQEMNQPGGANPVTQVGHSEPADAPWASPPKVQATGIE